MNALPHIFVHAAQPLHARRETRVVPQMTVENRSGWPPRRQLGGAGLSTVNLSERELPGQVAATEYVALIPGPVPPEQVHPRLSSGLGENSDVAGLQVDVPGMHTLTIAWETPLHLARLLWESASYALMFLYAWLSLRSKLAAEMVTLREPLTLCRVPRPPWVLPTASPVWTNPREPSRWATSHFVPAMVVGW